jgi:hypothetical protein
VSTYVVYGSCDEKRSQKEIKENGHWDLSFQFLITAENIDGLLDKCRERFLTMKQDKKGKFGAVTAIYIDEIAAIDGPIPEQGVMLRFDVHKEGDDSGLKIYAVAPLNENGIVGHYHNDAAKPEPFMIF